MSGFAWKETRGLRYAELGAGPEVVVIDGVGGLRPSRAHELLAESRRLIVFPLPEREANAAALADAIGGGIASLGLDALDIMAHGAGAAVALHLAATQPVRSLALVAPLALAAPAGNGKAPLFAHPDRHGGTKPAADADARARRLAGAASGVEPLLDKIAAPVLALFGTEDRLVPSDQAGLYRTRLKDCNLMFVYDAAHLPDIERPEAVAFIAGEFFGRHDQFLVSRESGRAFP